MRGNLSQPFQTDHNCSQTNGKQFISNSLIYKWRKTANSQSVPMSATFLCNISLQQWTEFSWLPNGSILFIYPYNRKLAECLCHFAVNLPSNSNYITIFTFMKFWPDYECPARTFTEKYISVYVDGSRFCHSSSYCRRQIACN